jgi:hypothetical protein
VSTPGYFYSLLPGVYQQLDAERGQPLRALMQLLQEQYDALDANIGALYENWFIETCAPWVVPYIGKLTGIDYAADPQHAFAIQRAAVGNAVRFARRKGTLYVLQPLIWSATGWYALAVESALPPATISMAQSMPSPARTFALNGAPPSVSASLGSIINDVTLYVWRLASWPVTAVTAPLINYAAPVENAGMFTFDPLGLDTPLFAVAVDAPPMMSPSPAIAVPAPITRAALAADLAAYRASYSSLPLSEQPPNSTYYGPARSINATMNGTNVPPLSVAAGDLSDWNATGFTQRIVIDPKLGRIALPPGGFPAPMTTSYAYGFAAPIGGGPYERRDSLVDPATVAWVATVGASAEYTSLTAAFSAWESAGSPRALIRIVDSGTYTWELPITLPLDGALTIEAADQLRPAIVFGATGTIGGLSTGSAYFRLSGIRVEGPVGISSESLLDIDFIDCTIVPPVVPTYDFVPSGALVTPRSSHTATLVDTNVLLAGGSGSAPLADAELFSTDTFTSAATGSLNVARTLHTANLVGDDVWIIGGTGANDAALGSIETFATDAFTLSSASLTDPRWSHTATALDATRLIVIGGTNGSDAIAVAEIVDTAAGTVTPSASLNIPRWNHIAIPMAGGDVLIAGGENASGPVTTPELFVNGAFVKLPDNDAGAVASAASAALANGSTLIAGGIAAAGVTSAAALVSAGFNLTATGSMPDAASLLTATSLAVGDGRVLVAGGMATSGASASASLYNPNAATFEAAPPMTVARASHSATLLPNGAVLVAGGTDGSAPLGTTELFQQTGSDFSPPAIIVTSTIVGQGGVSFRIVRSIIGSMSLALPRVAVRAEDSIIDAFGSDAIFAITGDVAIDASFVRSTLFGSVAVSGLEGTIDSIFTGPVTVANADVSDVSYCYLPRGSNVGGYRCQPLLALQNAAAELDLPDAADLPPAIRALVLIRTTPSFLSTAFTSPEYAQLRAGSSPAIVSGSSEGSELGVFCAWRGTDRQTLIRQIVNDFIPAGRNAAIVYLT